MWLSRGLKHAEATHTTTTSCHLCIYQTHLLSAVKYMQKEGGCRSHPGQNKTLWTEAPLWTWLRKVNTEQNAGRWRLKRYLWRGSENPVGNKKRVPKQNRLVEDRRQKRGWMNKHPDWMMRGKKGREERQTEVRKSKNEVRKQRWKLQ